MQLSKNEISRFRGKVYKYHRENFRSMPWRETQDPYKILVSEIMLQQTQVDRVIPKYEEFIEIFPGIDSLAKAKFQKVLTYWSGLGYNRRAKFLHDSAKLIIENYEDRIPESISDLVKLPGIGHNTAAAIITYAFNKPIAYIETNIRAVIIHHFFNGRSVVHDNELMPVVEQVLDHKNPREWHWALMDYGVYIKKKYKNPSRKSKHHTKQSRFKGSNRHIRGQILKYLLRERGSVASIAQDLSFDKKRVEKNIQDLEKEGLLLRDGDIYFVE